MSTPSDDPTIPDPGAPPPRRRRPSRRWWRNAAAVLAALVLLGGGVGIGLAISGGISHPATAAPAPAPAPASQAGATKAGTKKAGGTRKIDPARQAWAHQYGQDHDTMPDLAPVSSASPAQQAAATDLLVRTEQATAKWSDPNAAKAAGYDLQASLARHNRTKGPALTRQMERIDAGTARPGAPMPMLHVPSRAARTDGKLLDPDAPETLMYGYTGHGAWKLMGVMYTANEAYPQPPPDPGGPITRWHYHPNAGGQSLMMHIFFVPGNDLAHAYALDMKS